MFTGECLRTRVTGPEGQPPKQASAGVVRERRRSESTLRKQRLRNPSQRSRFAASYEKEPLRGLKPECRGALGHLSRTTERIGEEKMDSQGAVVFGDPAIEALDHEVRRVHRVMGALGLLGWDQEKYMPRGGAEACHRMPRCLATRTEPVAGSPS